MQQQPIQNLSICVLGLCFCNLVIKLFVIIPTCEIVGADFNAWVWNKEQRHGVYLKYWQRKA